MNTMKAVILIMMSNVIYSSSAYAYPCKLISHEVIKTDDHLFQFDHAACLSSNNADNIPFLHVKTNSYDHAQQFSDWKQDHNYNTSDFWNLWNDDFSDHPVFTVLAGKKCAGKKVPMRSLVNSSLISMLLPVLI